MYSTDAQFEPEDNIADEPDTSPARLPRVALIGRANVGKSTLFNKLIEERRAVVSDVAGTTRDRNSGRVVWQGSVFEVIDTGGLDVNLHDELERHIALQTEVAIQKADLVVLVCDVTTGLAGFDHEIIARLREHGKTFEIAVNKVDSQAREAEGAEFYSLADPSRVHLVSAANGVGVGDLLDALASDIEDIDEIDLVDAQDEEPAALRVAILGQPNVGKSSLLNQFLGEERAIVSSVAHTTRDAVDAYIEHDGTLIHMVDTAGMRRGSRVDDPIEFYSINRARKILRRSDVVLLVLDATREVTKQDQRIASLIEERGAGVVIVLNKWDLVEKDHRTTEDYLQKLRAKLGFLHWAPVVFASAKTGRFVGKILDAAIDSHARMQRVVDQSELDEFLEWIMNRRKPWKKTARLEKPRLVKVRSFQQVRANPPTFEITTDYELHTSWIRYFTNRFREHFDFTGTPIIILNVSEK